MKKSDAIHGIDEIERNMTRAFQELRADIVNHDSGSSEINENDAMLHLKRFYEKIGPAKWGERNSGKRH